MKLRCIVCTGQILPDGERPVTVEDALFLVMYLGRRGLAHGRCSVYLDGGVMERIR